MSAAQCMRISPEKQVDNGILHDDVNLIHDMQAVMYQWPEVL